LNGDVQPRIKAPFPFQNILSKPWSVKISLTDGLVWRKLKIEEKVVHIAQRNQKRGVKEKSVNREKHEKDKMTEDSNTHGSEGFHVNNGNRKRFDVRVKALTMLDAHSIRIMKRTSECRINERVWKRHNAYT
jgi:hypothetical protein